MDYLTSYKLFLVGVVVLAVLFFIGGAMQLQWLMVASMVLFLANVIQFWIFYRCPGCGKRLNTNRGFGIFRGRCPYCGENLKN